MKRSGTAAIFERTTCDISRWQTQKGIYMGFRPGKKVTTGIRFAAIVAGVACALPAGHVSAQTITENLTADLSGFIDGFGNTPSPVAAIDASFTVTFNESGYIGPTTTGLTVNSFTGTTLGSPLEYAWDPSLDVLSIGASPVIGEIFGGQNDVVFQFNLSNPNAPRLSLCSDPGFICGSGQGNSLYYSSGYTLAGYPNDGWLATVANGVPVNSAPEIDAGSAAAAIALLVGGLAVLNGRGRGRARPIRLQAR